MASPELACVVGEVTGPPSQKKALLLEALQKALENAPPPSSGDIQNFRVVSVELEQGGFTGATRTRVTLEVNDGPLD
jgi:hypothetical protein